MLIKGDLKVDERGIVSYVNDFDFAGIKRFYVVENHSKEIRAWHGHLKESKYIYVTRGSVLFGIVSMDENVEMEKFVLSDKKPQVLYIPPENYNGFRTLTDNSQIIFFSNLTLEESEKDDYRKPKDLWKL